MNQKKVLIISIFLLIINIVLLIKNTINNTDAEESKTKKVVEKKCKLENKIDKKDNFVFLGDSITDWYPFDEMFDEDVPIVNSGIAGYETKDILDRMEKMVYQYNPSKVFLLIGTNDLKYEDDNEQEISENVIKILKNIKNNRPKAKLFVQSIYPVNREMKNHVAGERYNEEIKEVNSNIKRFCEKNDITYIDMYEILSDDDGNFKEEYTKDGLHPSTKGYIRITGALLKYIY